MYTTRFPIVFFLTTIALTFKVATLQEATTDNGLSTEVTTPFVAVPVDATYLLSVKYYVKEEGIQAVAAFIIANNASVYNISLSDLLQLTEIENKNFTEISKILDSFDLSSQEVFNFENIEATFQELNISLLDIYQRIRVGFIPDPKSNVPLLQEQLGIDQQEFDGTILYGNDSSLFAILKQSNFSAENIQKAFSIINKTPSDFYDFIKPYFFASLSSYPLPRLIEVSKNQGIDEGHLKELLDALDVGPSKYQSLPAFASALEDFTQMINNVEIIATIINPTQLISVNRILNKWKNIRNIADVYVESLDSAKTKYKVPVIDSFNDDCLYGPVALTPENFSFQRGVEVAQDYSTDHIYNCKYVTVIDNLFVEENIELVHNNKLSIISDFPNSTLFKVGSPLFCFGKLYGIAEELSQDKIGFRTFYCDPEIFDTTTIFAESAGGSLHVENYRIIYATLLGLLVVFRLIC